MIVIIICLIFCTLQYLSLINDQTRVTQTQTWNEINVAQGIATRLSPLGAKFYLYQEDGVNTYFFLNSAKDALNQLFYFHYIEFSFDQDAIIHHVLFYYEGNWNWHQFSFDKFQYEGFWVEQYVFFNEQSQIVIRIMQKTSFRDYNYPYQQLVDMEFTMFYGGNFNEIHPITKQLVYFQTFPGSILAVIADRIEDNIDIRNLDMDDFECSTEVSLQTNLIDFSDPQLYKLFMSEKKNQKYYKLQFWAKVQEEYDPFLYQTIHISRITANRFISSFDATGSNSFILDYNYNQQIQQWSMELKYSSYQMPIIVQFINGVDPLEKSEQIIINDFQTISNWHFISITYNPNQLTFEFSGINSQFSKLYQNVYQFSYIYYRLFLGGWINSYSTLERSFALIYFYDCVSNNKIVCHYSCETCFGPLDNHCLTCYANSNRQYNSDQHTCNCKLWYTDISNSCQFATYSDSIIELIQDYQYDNNQCQFGYFNYEMQCYKCPSASQSNQVACIECLMRPNDWIYKKSSCFNMYYQNQHDLQTAYVKQNIDIDIQNVYYLMVSGDLVSCYGCEICLEINECFLSKYQHLDKPTYIKCQQGYIQNDGECQKQQQYQLIKQNCSKYCKNCIQQTCLTCLDQQLYFLDIVGQCQICQIQHCKYCFQYNKLNYQKTSLFSIELESFYDDYQLGCALCENYYYFSFELKQCIRNQLSNECEYYIDEFGQIQCYSTQLNLQINQFQQILDCQNYMANCQKCVRNNLGILFCIQCEQGYFVNNEYGFCISCITFSLNVIDCYSESSNIEGYKLQFTGLIQYFTNQYIDFNKYIKSLNKVIINKCSYGMILHQNTNQCITSCINCSYCLIQDQLQCLKCDAFNNEINFYSQIDGTCYKCPYPCKFCLPLDQDQIFEYNPYFTQSGSQQTYKCLKNYDDSNTYIDQNSGLLKPILNKSPQLFRLTLLGTSSSSTITDYQYLISKSVQQFLNKNINAKYTPMSNVYSLNNYTLWLVNYKNESNQQMGYTYLYNITELLAYNNTFTTFNSMFQISSTYGFKVTIHNFTLNASINNNIFRFYSAKSLLLSRITLRNTTLNSSKVISVINFYQPSTINISNILILNSTIINSAFFNFEKGDNNKFYINNVTFVNCTFISSNFISQSFNMINQQFYIHNITIKNCTFIDSVLVLMSSSYDLQIIELYVNNSKFQNSTIMQTRSSLTMNDCTLNNTNLTDSVLFNLQFSEKNQLINVINVTANALRINQSTIISINPLQQSISGQGYLNRIQLYDILQLVPEAGQTDSSLVYLNNVSFEISNVLIDTLLYFLNAQECHTIKFTDFYVRQNQRKQNFQKLNMLYDQHTLIIMTNFQKLGIFNFSLIDVASIASPLIAIRSDNSDVQEIIFQEIYINSFMSFSFIKSINSAINIQIDNQCDIRIIDSVFVNNRFFYNVSNQELLTSSLLKIYSSQSNVLLSNLTLFNNSNYNSSEAQIYLVGTTIQLSNINASFINFKSQQLKSLCGLGILEGQFIKITDSYFYNVFSIYYGFFYIQSQFSGMIVMKNNTFKNSDLLLVQKGGVISLDGSQSSINLLIMDTSIENIFSQLSGAFLYFQSSQISNQIQLDQIHLKNVHSTDNSFAKFEFSNSTAANNVVKISNIMINNSISNYYNLIYTVDTINSINSSQLIGYLSSSYSNFTLVNLTYIGELTQPFLSLTYMNKVFVKQLRLINITLQFSFSYLIQLSNYKIGFIQDIIINNVSTTLNQQNMVLISSSQVPKAFLENFILQAIECPNCENGLINFISSTSSSQIIRFFNLLFYYNICGQRSCIISNNNYMIIENSVIIGNNVNQQAALQIVSGNISLKNVKFKNNIAQMNGGALFLSQCQIIFQNVYIINNTALSGGGIYFDQGKLDKEQIQQLYLSENNGTKGINHLREQPDFLKLKTYGILLKNKKQNISQYAIETPEYIVNYQQLRINSTFIMTSSGYSVQDSEIFNISTMNYIKTNISLQIIQFNQLGEQVIDTLSNKCQLQQYFINETLNYTYLELINNKQKENQTSILFNQTLHSYPLDDLIIYLDPYLNSSFYILIDCQCNSFLNNTYHFQFKVKTQKCGIGQFYQNSICQKCDYDKGYYSVEKNSIECQRMDPKQIKSVTQSSLELQPGYWRIDYYSSHIDQCQFYSQFCLGGWNVNYNSCSLGYIGALCEECDIYNIRGDIQYIKSLLGYCYIKNISSGIIVTLISVLLILFFITYLLQKIQENMQQNYKKMKLKSHYYKILYKYSVDLMKAHIKQAIFLIQILYILFPPTQILIGEFSQVIWPLGNASQIALHFIDILSDKISINIIYAKAIGSIILPLLYISFLTIMFVSYQRRSKEINIYNIQTIILFLICYSMPNICEQLAQLISSRSIADLSWIGGNVAYQYYTSEHQYWLTYFLLPAAIIILIILPLSFFQALLYEVKNNQDPTVGFSGYLITFYNQKYYYWELITLEMILMVTFLNSYLESVSIIFKDLFIIFILFIYYAGISYTKPFVFKKLNQIEKVGIAFDCFIASLSCIQYQASQEDLIEVQTLMAVMMVFLLIALLLYLLAGILICYYNKYSEAFDQTRIRIKKQFPQLESKCPMLKIILQSRIETRKRVYQRFQYLKVQIRIMKLNNSRSMRSALNFMNEEPHGVIISNILRQENRQLIISSPMHQSIIM